LVIVYEATEESCKVSSLKENISGGQFGQLFILDNTIDKSTLISKFDTTYVNCGTFNRAADDKCDHFDLSAFDGITRETTCSVGFNTIK